MEFGPKKYSAVTKRRGKLCYIVDIALLNDETSKEVEKHAYRYLRKLELDRINEKAMKVKFNHEY